MKNKAMIALCTALNVFGVAVEPTALTSPAPSRTLLDAQPNYNSWRSYLRLGISNSRPSDLTHVFPDLGLGVRVGLPLGAVDISASYMGTVPFVNKEEVSGEEAATVVVKEQTTFFFTLPRVSYLLFTSPEKDQSFFGGLGVAYGALKASDQSLFNGLIPSLSLGYEMNRLQRMSNFFQLDVSQPALETSWEKSFVKVADWDLGPVVQFSAGCGF